MSDRAVVPKPANSRRDGPAQQPGLLDGTLLILREEGLPGLALRITSRLGARTRLFVIALLIAAPALLALFFIHKYAVNVSVNDDLVQAYLFDKLYNGHLSFGDFWAQHTDSRGPFPRLLMLGLGAATHDNTIATDYVTWFLICLIGCVLCLVLIREFGEKTTALLAFIPIAWLLFNLRQWENLLWGLNASVYLGILSFLLAVYLLATSRGLDWRFALAVVSGVVSSFSFVNNLLIWPMGVMLIVWMCLSRPREMTRSYVRMGAVWAVLGIAICVSYFVGYHRVSSASDALEHPVGCLKYFLAVAGSLALPDPLWFKVGLSNYLSLPIGVGLILVLLCAFAIVTIVLRGKVSPCGAVSVCLILYALLSMGMMAVGRYSSGIEDAVYPRHTTWAVVGMVGLYMAVVSSRTKHVAERSFLLGLLTSLVIVTIYISCTSGMDAGRQWKEIGTYQAYLLRTYRFQSDERLSILWIWDVQLAREGAEILERHKLNVFSEPTPKVEELAMIEGDTDSRIETINDVQPGWQGSDVVQVSLQAKELAIVGWAVDRAAGSAAGAVFVTVDGQIDIPVLYGKSRSDVASYFGEKHYRSSGFSAWIPISVIGEGRHTLSLKIVTADKKGYYEATQNVIVEIG
jgi:hypothetical protein